MHPRKSALWLAIAFILGCGISLASQPVLVITSSGYFYLDTDSSGSPISVPVSKIVDLRSGSDPDGPDVPAPQPDTPDIELTRLAKGWAESVVDPQGSQAMELVYLQIADAIKAGHLNVDTAPTALVAASDSVLGTLSKADAWKPFRKSAGDELTERRQRGKVDSAASMESFLRAVAMGLQMSADGSDAITLSETLQIVTATNKAIDGAKN
jgi:hypothetical protein